ncbi:MAG: peroxiredoxin-like family protein [Bacteroidota bacterium]
MSKRYFRIMLAVLLAGGPAIGTVAQSPAEAVCPLKVNSGVPAVAVKDAQGTAVKLQELIGDKPTVVVFYRGGWCGYCNRQLSDLQAHTEQLAAAGYQLLAISPDLVVKSKDALAEHGLTFPLYADNRLEAAQAFGVAFQLSEEMQAKMRKYNIALDQWSGEDTQMLPVPAVFVFKDGKVQFQHVNPDYSKRLEAAVLVQLLNAL